MDAGFLRIRMDKSGVTGSRFPIGVGNDNARQSHNPNARASGNPETIAPLMDPCFRAC
jgi:hypothetical protein